MAKRLAEKAKYAEMEAIADEMSTNQVGAAAAAASSTQHACCQNRIEPNNRLQQSRAEWNREIEEGPECLSPGSGDNHISHRRLPVLSILTTVLT